MNLRLVLISGRNCSACRQVAVFIEPVILEVKKIVPEAEIVYTKYTIGEDSDIPVAYTGNCSTVPVLFVEKEGSIVWQFNGVFSKLKLTNVLLNILDGE
jgi:hypothetical protein